jgi:hypothetical protein
VGHQPRNRSGGIYIMKQRIKMNAEDINNFSMAIEEMVYMKDIPYIDAIVMYCEENGFEVEMAAKLVSGVLKSKVQLEAEDLHYLKKSNTSQLPL